MGDTAPTSPADKANAAIAALWLRKLSEVEARLDLLDRAAATTPLNDELQTEARDVAHKFAGSLGMYGFPRGTLLAQQLELLLEGPDPDRVTLSSLTNQLRELLFPPSQTL